MNEATGQTSQRTKARTQTRCGTFALASAAALLLFLAAPSAGAQAFSAASAYNMQPGTVPLGAASGVFSNSTGGLLDFAVLEQVPGTGSSQVEIFHGKSDGTFCTNCGNAAQNPDVIPLGSGVTGNAIAVGQFRAGSAPDIAVATNGGIVFLQNKNDGSGTFALGSNAISSTNGFATLAVGQFNGDANLDLAAATPSVSGSVSFTVFFGDGTGAFPTRSSSVAVSGTYNQCTAIMPDNFQGQTSGADLALACNNPSLASVLVYLNSGSGAFTLNQTLSAGNSFGGTLPGVAVGTLNNRAAIFVSPVGSSFISYQGNGLAGSSNAFSSVSMIPVGSAPRGSLAILFNSPTAAVDFASVNNGVGISTFTSYSQSGANVNGTWNSTARLGPNGTLATGSSNLAQGTTYVVIGAGTQSGFYSDPNVSGPPNFEPYVDQRSIAVFLVTLNGDGTVKTANAAPVFPGTGLNGYAAPPTFATGDFNGDGTMDLAVGGAILSTGDASVEVYLANSNGSLPVPPVPVTPPIDVANTNNSGADAVVAGKFRPAQSGKTLYDLAVFSFGQIAIFTSNGDGSFNAGGAYSLLGDPNYPGFLYNPGSGHPFAPVLTATDVNGDGLDDLVLTLPEDNCGGSGSPSRGAVYILLSKGDGTFQSPVFVAPPVVNPVSAAAAKFFGSTLPDLVFADGGELCAGNTATTTTNSVGILRNQVAPGATTVTAGNFTAGQILSQSSDLGTPNITAVASGDLNGDGHPDLVVSGTNGIQVLLNSGTGTFSATAQGVVPLYQGDAIPGPLCNNAGHFAGCVTYDSHLAIGSFFTSGEADVAAAVNGVAYIFKNSSGTLTPPTEGFVAGPDSSMVSALPGSNGTNSALVATSQGTAYLSNGGGAGGGPSFANYSTAGPIGFGNINVGSNGTQQLVLTNTGGAAFTIGSVTVASSPSVYSLANVVCNQVADFPFSNPVTLNPGGVCTFTIQFSPNAPAGFAGSITIGDNAAGSNAGPGLLGVTGQSIYLSGAGVEPSAVFSPTALNFGSVYENASATLPVTLTNNGTGPLTVDAIFVVLIGQNNTGFAPTAVLCNGIAAQYPVTLTNGQTCTVTVQFDPTAAANYSASLFFDDNAGPGESNLTSTLTGSIYQQALPLTGAGIPPIPDNETISVTDTDTVTPLINIAAPVAEFSTGTLGFGGQDGSQTLTISEIGLASMTVNSATTVSPFSVSQIACSNGATSFATTLPSGGTCTLTITYTGTSPATDAGTLTFTDSAALSNLTSTASGSNFAQSITLSASGTTTAPPPPPPTTVNVPASGPDSEIITVTDNPVIKVFFTPTVKLAVSPAGPVTDGAPVTLSAQVISPAGGPGTPTGTVSFLNDGILLQTQTLAQGSAVVTTSSLPSGLNSITASYSGDSNFAPEVSAAQSITVNSPDYTVSANPSTLTLGAGQSGTTTITVTSLGYLGTVTFSCGNLPSFITCAFNPPSGTATLSLGSITQTLTLTVSVLSTIAKLQPSRTLLIAIIFPVGLLGLVPVVGKKRKRMRLCFVLAAMLSLGATIAGCSGSGAGTGTGTLPPVGTQSFVVNASGSSGNVSHQLQLNIIITN